MTPQPVLEPRPEPRPEPSKATGPTTPEGKDRSRLNALRHGLSGQTVLMPWEDQGAYQTHCAAIVASLTPVGELETQSAQGVADDQWRLNRARATDTNMFALGQVDYAPATGDPQIDAALNSARAFRDNSKVFVNLSLYEQRINRSLEKNFDRLEALQNARKEREFLAAEIAARQLANQLANKDRAKTFAADPGVVGTFALAPSVRAASPAPPQMPGLVPTTTQSKEKASGQPFVYASAPQPASHAAPTLKDADPLPKNVRLTAA